MILITGATGNVGSELITALLPPGRSHTGPHPQSWRGFPDGTQKVVADLGESTLAPVLDGVHAVFLLTDGLHIAAHDQRLIAAAPRAGVERIVKLSVRNVGHDAADPITSWHRAGEEAIRDSGIRVDVPAAYRVHVQRAQLGGNDRGRSDSCDWLPQLRSELDGEGLV